MKFTEQELEDLCDAVEVRGKMSCRHGLVDRLEALHDRLFQKLLRKRQKAMDKKMRGSMHPDPSEVP